jgi:hypothetical protein
VSCRAGGGRRLMTSPWPGGLARAVHRSGGNEKVLPSRWCAALQDAASVAGLLVTTEAMVAETQEKKAPPMPRPPPKGRGTNCRQ